MTDYSEKYLKYKFKYIHLVQDGGAKLKFKSNFIETLKHTEKKCSLMLKIS